MSVDLYGESYVSNWDYARKIVTLGAKLPFYKVHSFVTPIMDVRLRFLWKGLSFFNRDTVR